MDQETDTIKFTIRDVEEDTFITISGVNQHFLIGLNREGDICSENVCGEGPGGICVGLIRVCISGTGGLTMAPGNKDLPCQVQGETLHTEVNVISGTTVEVADKTIQICAGEMKKTRRKLPRTPGTVTDTKPPPKPKRTVMTLPQTEPEVDPKEKDHHLQGNWEVIQRPDVNSEILANLNSPPELGILSASFLTKQIQQYTDVRLSVDTTDAIFKFLQEIAFHQKGLLVAYLTETSEKLEEMPEAERDRPMHRPAVKLLVELLRQILDPLDHVVLCLQLLRTFSHFPSNLTTMIQCQAPAAILGTMAVYVMEKQVQEYGLDILAKVATYRPHLQHKLPLRETGLEMILRAMNHHTSDTDVTQSGTRTLANLTSTLEEILDSLLDLDCEADLCEVVERYEKLLCHIFEQAIQVVQRALQDFTDNITIKTDGRRFLYNYSKMTQISLKKNAWIHQPSPDDDAEKQNIENITTTANVQDLTTPSTFLKVTPDDKCTKGILKPRGVAVELTGPEKKVHFPDDDDSDDSLLSESSTDDDEDGKDFRNRRSRQRSSRVDVCYGDEPILVVQKTELLSPEFFASNKEPDEVYSNEDNESIDDNDDVFEIFDEPDVSKNESSHNSSTTSGQGEENCMDLNENSDVCAASHVPDRLLDTQADQQEEDMESPVSGNDNSVPREESDKGGVHRVLRDVLGDGMVPLDVSDEGAVPPVEASDDSGGSSTPPIPARVPIQSTTQDVTKFTAADVDLLIKVVYLTIVNYISGLVFGDEESFALAIVDHPLRFLTEKSGAVAGVLTFVEDQFERNKTLMDVDPTFLISLIDAVRYKSVLCDLHKKMVLDVCKDLTKSHSPSATTLGLATVVMVIKDTKSFTMVTDESFNVQMESIMDSVEAALPTSPQVTELRTILHQPKS